MNEHKGCKKTVLVVPLNHFDPSWRRCFDKKATLGNTSVASYAEIEGMVFDRWIGYGQTISEGQTAVLRKYIEKHPDKKEVLKKMARSGEFACLRSGVTVQDTNLPAPEGLIRNFLTEEPFYRELAGEDHTAQRIVPTYDSFGNSANYPQIIRGVGADATYKVCYKLPEGKVWEGIDGSRVLYLDRFYSEVGLGTFEKHPWCEKCRGKGCGSCNNTGINEVPPLGFEAICATLKSAAERGENFVVAYIGGEEMMPEKDLKKAMEAVSGEYGDVDFRLGTSTDVYLHCKPELEKALSEEKGATKELNPVFQGCYVSRIAIKQTVRRLSYMLTVIESKLASAGFSSGSIKAVPEELNEAWRLITFCQFHDVITGTLIDSAYSEAMEMLSKAERIISRYLPDSSAYGAKADDLSDIEFRKADRSDVYTVSFGDYTLSVSDGGIVSCRLFGEDLFGVKPYGRLYSPFCIGELALEPDMGDSWATRVMPCFAPVNNQSLLQLGDYQHLESIGDDKIVWSGCYRDKDIPNPDEGTDYMVKKLKWKTVLKLGENGALEFKTTVDWDTFSRRIRVIFPVNSNDWDAYYEIPFGYVKRAYEADKVNYHEWSPNYMEYPAQNWVMQRTGERSGVAFLNHGLPCWRWYPGCFELSVLRSPQGHFVGNEQRNYEFNDFNGLRDAGVHTFEYAILPYTDGRSISDITKTALEYNRGEDFELPFEVIGNAVVTAFKPSQDGGAAVLRFYNPLETEQKAEIRFEKNVTVCECDLLEKENGQSKTQKDVKSYEKSMRPFEIVTMKIVTE